MEGGNIILCNNIDQNIKTSVRYGLVQKMMEENFNKWISQQNTLNLIQKLIEDCKKPNISLVLFKINLVNPQSDFCYQT
jgi:hypothetical protein